MAKINLEKMSLSELNSLMKDVEKAISNFEKKKRADAKAALEAVAKQHGYSLSEIVGGGSPKSSRAGAPAKYRNPANPAQTWSGRGRQPAWYKDAIKAGKKPESMAI